MLLLTQYPFSLPQLGGGLAWLMARGKHAERQTRALRVERGNVGNATGRSRKVTEYRRKSSLQGWNPRHCNGSRKEGRTFFFFLRWSKARPSHVRGSRVLDGLWEKTGIITVSNVAGEHRKIPRSSEEGPVEDE